MERWELELKELLQDQGVPAENPDICSVDDVLRRYHLEYSHGIFSYSPPRSFGEKLWRFLTLRWLYEKLVEMYSR